MTHKLLHWLSPAIFPVLLACSAPVDPGLAQTDESWDSAGGNPTHATHSYLTEHALDSLQFDHPDLATYRTEVVTGANLELHELAVADVEQESLRLEAGGTNWGCERPEVYWAHAKERWAAGDRAKAYWFVGILLHFVEDLGAPAHAFRVWHEASPSNWDHFEVMAFQRWAPSYDAIDQWDPGYAEPADYVAFSGWWTETDFETAFPDVTYTRTLFPMSWFFARSEQRQFVRDRQGRTAAVATWALGAAASALEAL